MSDDGDRPLILTIFGGRPAGPVNTFAAQMHRDWGLALEDVIEHRRREESCAAEALGAESCWLDLPDAIYRGERYLSDEHLFGAVHPDDALLFREIRSAILAFLEARNIMPDVYYCPLAVGNHVDHQLVLATARTLTYTGRTVIAWEDFPYAGEAGAAVDEIATRRSSGEPRCRILTPTQLDSKVSAVNCYASQHEVIFRRQGDPAEATRAYAERVGNGTPAERFWPLEAPS